VAARRQDRTLSSSRSQWCVSAAVRRGLNPGGRGRPGGDAAGAPAHTPAHTSALMYDHRTMTDRPQITVRHLAEADRQTAGRIYAAAFPRMIEGLVPRRTDLGAAIVAEVLLPAADIWLAELDGEVAGLAWLRDHDRPGPKEHTWRAVRRHLPLRAAARACLFSYMLHGVALPEDRLYLDSLAVDPRFEGRGVGGALMRHVIAEARRRHKTAVSLFVIDREQRPYEIYRHFGFVTGHSESPRLFRRVIGFDRTDYMELDLDDARGVAEDPRPTLRDKAGDLLDACVWRKLPPQRE
jgi:GNAT superfamily N-acetyltransferase